MPVYYQLRDIIAICQRDLKFVPLVIPRNKVYNDAKEAKINTPAGAMYGDNKIDVPLSNDIIRNAEDYLLLLGSNEVIKVYNWRARNELQIEHSYNRNVIAKHVVDRKLHQYYLPYENRKRPLYDLREVFTAGLNPQKGVALREAYEGR